MTKADIAAPLHEKLNHNGFSKNDCVDLTEMVLELIKSVIIEEGKLKISGFGNFEVKSKNDRKGRNPMTGEEMMITARKVLTYKPCVGLRNKINGAEKAV